MQPLRRYGLTLVELLVVIVLLTILTAAVLPIMAPAVESRRMREAARGVSIFFSTARSRAIQSGRPVGVEIQRIDYSGVGGGTNNSIALTLFEVEVPSPYGGDDISSAATVAFDALPNSVGVAAGTVNLIGGFRSNLVRAGDRIQLGCQGPFYGITSIASATSLRIETPRGTAALPWPPTVTSQAMPYQIFRQPRRTSSDPYQLPQSIVIDMDGSGIGPSGLFGSFDGMSNLVNDPFPVVVLFSPGGALTSIYQSNVGPLPPVGDVFLLIGKGDKSPLNHTLKNYNWLDPECLWVTVRRQSGQVTTTAMHPSTVPSVAPPDAGFPAQYTNGVVESRYFAREAYGEGGR